MNKVRTNSNRGRWGEFSGVSGDQRRRQAPSYGRRKWQRAGCTTDDSGGLWGHVSGQIKKWSSGIGREDGSDSSSWVVNLKRLLAAVTTTNNTWKLPKWQHGRSRAGGPKWQHGWLGKKKSQEDNGSSWRHILELPLSRLWILCWEKERKEKGL